MNVECAAEELRIIGATEVRGGKRRRPRVQPCALCFLLRFEMEADRGQTSGEHRLMILLIIMDKASKQFAVPRRARSSLPTLASLPPRFGACSVDTYQTAYTGISALVLRLCKTLGPQLSAAQTTAVASSCTRHFIVDSTLAARGV